MGELSEGCPVVDGVINVVWYETVTDIPQGIHLQTVLFSFAWPWLGCHYDIPSRKLRFGWWMHWICLYREDRWPLPCVGFFKSKYFYKERGKC